MNNCKIIAEIGINHNGSLDTAKDLMMLAKVSGCDFAKFQKRTPELCVPEEQKNKMRETPWGKITYLEYKKRIEFNKKEYDELDKFAKTIGLKWFASVWDLESVEFMSQYTDICKIPSALLTDNELLISTRKKFNTLILSTGMSNEEEIEKAIDVGNPDVIMHTNSSYPSKEEELNLNYIKYLKNKYPSKEIGYSGHEFGLIPTFSAVSIGAEWIERHITLDRNMWGSDHLSSVEPVGVFKLVKGIRTVEMSLGSEFQTGRVVFGSELDKRKSLRGV